eukprot:CAMPEP_0176363958 /NCGR_PEP_ID=MMETSP0126-20121128/19474_1 /TAXON_ID=141414 ORGANISM="Strombidinopsis acuminatum, Strain SPMC142" /NCGR_SAMPLE_ID=MMETSP0126 /ASSEMBLY_ACC=CAM_ASM_000229 /LENGTH=44 /DNA_ID= /DNA_START= /DNA_END= /DNA_ORIENTATION=
MMVEASGAYILNIFFDQFFSELMNQAQVTSYKALKELCAKSLKS